MLIPRFTVRRLLVITAVCGCCFLIFSLGLQGHYWAAAILTVVVSFLLILLLHVGLFAVAWVISLLVVREASQVVRSPFSEHRQPPQVIPEDPE